LDSTTSSFSSSSILVFGTTNPIFQFRSIEIDRSRRSLLDVFVVVVVAQHNGSNRTYIAQPGQE
jgi:hypothetical protein